MASAAAASSATDLALFQDRHPCTTKESMMKRHLSAVEWGDCRRTSSAGIRSAHGFHLRCGAYGRAYFHGRRASLAYPAGVTSISLATLVGFGTGSPNSR